MNTFTIKIIGSVHDGKRRSYHAKIAKSVGTQYKISDIVSWRTLSPHLMNRRTDQSASDVHTTFLKGGASHALVSFLWNFFLGFVRSAVVSSKQIVPRESLIHPCFSYRLRCRETTSHAVPIRSASNWWVIVTLSFLLS